MELAGLLAEYSLEVELDLERAVRSLQGPTCVGYMLVSLESFVARVGTTY